MTPNATMKKSARNGTASTTPVTVRVAIYCRKSTEKGLDQSFNSIDAQRATVEAYITSQRGNGWTALPTRYDDGGYTGANTDRPAFQRLLDDVRDGRVDVVATYRLDRLSRSQRDFFATLDLLEQHGVTFVSVTEQFNTTTSQGRFALSISAAVAQLEREVTAQRTAEKAAATRRNGMSTGGRPILGLDAVGGGRLVVNAVEAAIVRRIFARFIECGSVTTVVADLRNRGVTNKSWTNRKGRVVVGRPFDKSTLRHLLANPLYVGEVTLGDERHKGVHEAIVPRDVFDRAQKLLRRHTDEQRGGERNKWGVLLGEGLLRCAVCSSPMQHHYASRGNRRYSSYVCAKYSKEGAAACPNARVTVRDVESFVVERIKAIGRDPELAAATIEAARAQLAAKRPEAEADLARLDADRTRLTTERANLVGAIGTGGDGTKALIDRVAEVEEQLATLEQREKSMRDELAALEGATIDGADLTAALAKFDDVWSETTTAERTRVLRLLLEGVVFNGVTGEISITFRANGIKGLAHESNGDNA